MHRRNKAACASLLLALSGTAIAAACEALDSLSLKVSVREAKVLRTKMPSELFGFNMPWRDFQLGFFADGVVHPELVELLRPFKGASYRYPGGSPSNSFDWEQATGPRALRRPQHADFGRFARTDFGLPEFARFMSSVGGRAILTMNLIGPYKQLAPIDALRGKARHFGQLVSATNELSCKPPKACPLFAVELGNEVDWQPSQLSASEYVERAEAVRAEVDLELPNLTWIANGRTAPWDTRSKNARRFNGELATAMAGGVSGIAIHPYYDGIAVPEALNYVRSYGDTWRALRKDAQVFVTEHARWPAQPSSGRWEDNWYQANSLGGAISTADFLLGLMSIPTVANANWHALSTEGPWQLIRREKPNGVLVPSPVYWGMRVLREAYLENLVDTVYMPTVTTNYGGKYDQRIVAMQSADEALSSVLGVNRASRPVTLTIEWASTQHKAGTATMQWITGASERADNTEAQTSTVRPLSTKQSVSSSRSQTVWCVPPRSVFSVLEP